MKKILLTLALLLGAGVARAGDTVTPRLGLTKPAIGSIGWGVKWNTNLDILDPIVASLLKPNVFTSSSTFSGGLYITGLDDNGVLYNTGSGRLGTNPVLTLDPSFSNFYTLRLGRPTATDAAFLIQSSTSGSTGPTLNFAGGNGGSLLAMWNDVAMTMLSGQIYGTNLAAYPFSTSLAGDFVIIAGAASPNQANRIVMAAGDQVTATVSSTTFAVGVPMTGTSASFTNFIGGGAGLTSLSPLNISAGTLPDNVKVTTGNVTASGTPSSSTFLRGDGSWQSVGASYWTANGSDVFNNNAGDVMVATGPLTSQARLTVADNTGAGGASLALYENTLGGSVVKFNNFAGVLYATYNGGTFMQTTSSKFTSIGDGSGAGNPEISFEAVHDSTTSSSVFSVLDANMSARNSSNANQKLVFGYNSSAEKGWMQAVKVGTGNKPLLLNPNGGAVAVGTGTVTTDALDIVDGGMFGLPRTLGPIRGTMTPGREGAQVYDITSHGVCTATGTTVNTWILGVSGSTPCPD